MAQMVPVHAELESGVLEMRQLFFNNLNLLGFDGPAMEASNHIPFNKSMFDLPNRRGAEIVLHYLFQRLNSTMCREAFRDCWPILDKKREMLFRKTCASWLSNISQEESDSHLPRINASLFMSPGGEKFIQLLYLFSSYVLQKVLDTELGSKQSDRVRYPTLTQQNLQLVGVIEKDLTCAAIRHRKRFFDVSQQILKANRVWKDTAHNNVREYRKLIKEIRENDYKLREEEQRATEACLIRGSPSKRRGQSDHFEPDFDPRTIKRAQRLQQVREMWKQLETFDKNEAAEREVIRSIVERTVEKNVINAADISVKVPDLLLRECQEEIRRRNIENTYQGGRLNLVSLIQLWHLSLELYLEKIKEVGIPQFEDASKLTSQVHTQQSYLQNAKTLRQEMSDRIPEMKSSVAELSSKLDTVFFVDKSPESIRSTSIGLDLVEPSPQPSFSPKSGKTPTAGLHVPRTGEEVSTPDAAARIAEGVKATVRKGPAQLFGEKHDQVLANVHLVTGDRKSKSETSIPQPSSQKKSSKVLSQQSSKQTSRSVSQASSRQGSRPTSRPTSQPNSRPTSGRSTASSQGSKRSGRGGSVQLQGEKRHILPQGAEDLPGVASPRTLMDSYRSLDDSQQSVSGSFHGSRGDGDSPRSLSSTLTGGSKKGRLTPTDLLVEEIMGEAEVLSPFTGLDAFETRENMARTPDIEEEQQQQEQQQYQQQQQQYQLQQQQQYQLQQQQQYQLQQQQQYQQQQQQYQQQQQQKYQQQHQMYEEDQEDIQEEDEKDEKENITPTGEDDYVVDVQGPELDDSGDESDVSGKSAEQLILIDRSIHQSPNPVSSQSNQYSPRVTETSPTNPGQYDHLDDHLEDGIDQEQFPDFDDFDGSPVITRSPIIVDHSFSAARSEFSPEAQPENVNRRENSFLNQSTESKKSNQRTLNQSGSLTGSHHSSRKGDSGNLMSQSADFDLFTEEDERLQSAKSRLPFSKSFSEDVCSPLREEIRKMYKEAMADSTPVRPSTGTQSRLRNMQQDTESPQPSDSDMISPQVELEGLVFGENIVRRRSDYFSQSGHLSEMFNQLKDGDKGDNSEHPNLETKSHSSVFSSPGMDEMLKRVKSAEEKLVGRGTPPYETPCSDDELELPVLDPNSMPCEDSGGEDKDWDLDNIENLDDIEMPEMGLDEDSYTDSPEKNHSYFTKEVVGDFSFNSPQCDETESDKNALDDFFMEKTPELPKRSQQVLLGQGDSGSNILEGSLDSELSPRPPKFPQVLSLQDEQPLISFTP